MQQGQGRPSEASAAPLQKLRMHPSCAAWKLTQLVSRWVHLSARCAQYWLGGNTDNLENLLLNISSAYVPALNGVDFSVEEPVLPPDVGIWHPLAPAMYEDLKEYLNW